MTKSQVKRSKGTKKKSPSQRKNGGLVIGPTHPRRCQLCRDSRTKRNSTAQCGTQKSGSKPCRINWRKQGRINSIFGENQAEPYSHSFTLVYCCVIPVDSSWLVDFDRHATESRRVTSRRRLGQILGQKRELFRNREPAVSFLSRGQKWAGFEAQKHPKWMPKVTIILIDARLTK